MNVNISQRKYKWSQITCLALAMIQRVCVALTRVRNRSAREIFLDAPGEPADGRLDEYISDGEMVLRFLEEFEGYTWQGHVVSEMGWTKSKTSRVLSNLEDAGQISRRRIGRQKAVYLPDHVPESIEHRQEAAEERVPARPRQ